LFVPGTTIQLAMTTSVILFRATRKSIKFDNLTYHKDGQTKRGNNSVIWRLKLMSIIHNNSKNNGKIIIALKSFKFPIISYKQWIEFYTLIFKVRIFEGHSWSGCCCWWSGRQFVLDVGHMVGPLNYSRCDTKHRLPCTITPFY